MIFGTLDPLGYGSEWYILGPKGRYYVIPFGAQVSTKIHGPVWTNMDHRNRHPRIRSTETGILEVHKQASSVSGLRVPSASPVAFSSSAHSKYSVTESRVSESIACVAGSARARCGSFRKQVSEVQAPKVRIQIGFLMVEALRLKDYRPFKIR